MIEIVIDTRIAKVNMREIIKTNIIKIGMNRTKDSPSSMMTEIEIIISKIIEIKEMIIGKEKESRIKNMVKNNNNINKGMINLMIKIKESENRFRNLEIPKIEKSYIFRNKINKLKRSKVQKN
jgi:hypothetical protein